MPASRGAAVGGIRGAAALSFKIKLPSPQQRSNWLREGTMVSVGFLEML